MIKKENETRTCLCVQEHMHLWSSYAQTVFKKKNKKKI